MKVAVLGAGAIGAYVGAALHRAGADVHLVARGAHLTAMRRDGVRVLSPRGDFTARAHATDDPAEIGPVDYVFLGLKAHSCAACGPLIEPLLHGTTAVVAAQNGIPWWYFHRHGGPHHGHRLESVDPGGTVSAVLAPERAVGCVVYAATELEGPGVVRHLEGTRFSVGEPDRSVSERCTAFGEGCVRRWRRRSRPRRRRSRRRPTAENNVETLVNVLPILTMGAPAYAAIGTGREPRVDNDLYVRDYDKGILCYKCVDACGDQWQNSFAISVAGRGFDARIAVEHDALLTDAACVYCGNCVEVCPTGALSFRSEFDRRAAGTWDESAQTRTATVCAYCGVGCNLTLHVQDNEIVKVTSPHDNPVTHGNLCIKGRFGYQHVQNRG
ncbi:2-dehydropantoate 2-reductase [Streptomyces bobili]|uniref:2-dehydropantoate 2-reductase n=1 Tax=Streptomyces bobili TaxID=67280 RepID=UPI0036F97196